MKITHKISGGFIVLVAFLLVLLFYFFIPRIIDRLYINMDENIHISASYMNKTLEDERQKINSDIRNEQGRMYSLFINNKLQLEEIVNNFRKRMVENYLVKEGIGIIVTDKFGTKLASSSGSFPGMNGELTALDKSFKIHIDSVMEARDYATDFYIKNGEIYLVGVGDIINSKTEGIGYIIVYYPIGTEFIDAIKAKLGIDVGLDNGKSVVTTIIDQGKRTDNFPRSHDKLTMFNGKTYSVGETEIRTIFALSDSFRLLAIKNINASVLENANLIKTSVLIIVIILIFAIFILNGLSIFILKGIGDIKNYIIKISNKDYDFKIDAALLKRNDEIGISAKNIEKIRNEMAAYDDKIKYYTKELDSSYKEMKNYIYIVEVKNKELTERLKEQELIKEILNMGIKEVSEISRFFKFLIQKIYDYKKYKRFELIYKNSIDNGYERIIYIPEKEKFVDSTYNDNLKYLIAERPVVKEDYIEIPIKREKDVVGCIKIEGIELSGNTEKTIEILVNELEMVLESSELYYKMDKKIMELSFLNSISVALSSVNNINELKKMVEDSVAVLFGINNYQIYIYEKGYFLDFKEMNGEIVKIKQKKVDDESMYILNKYGNLKIKKDYYIPLVVKEKLVGAICAENIESFRNMDKNIARIFLTQLSIILQNTLMFSESRKKSFDIIKTLAETIEEKDTYTRGHSERVMNYAIKIAEKMKLTAEDIEKIKYAGILHDIGKIGIPESILQKSTRLTDEEYEIIKSHPVKGAKILSHISSMEDIAKVVKHHHERPDGKGYPEGLRNEEIPLFSKILSIADTYDAMTSDRPYRNSLTLDVVIEEMKRYSGQQFDSQILEIFIEMLSNGEVKHN